MASRNRLRFGEFTLDLDARQLFKQDEIHLSPKAFELLVVLVRDRPRAISKADLQTRLWPDAFVTEASLFGLIREIRLVLGDDPRHPRFIRTLHGFGYAFAAEVDDAAAPMRQDPSPHPTFWILADSQVRLAEGLNILGRDPDATVWFDRPGVSRRHARIVVNGGEAAIEDLDSTNGTWVGDERISAATPLRDGDVIRLGPVAVTFRVRRAAASTEALL